jgi:hypothetical protein
MRVFAVSRGIIVIAVLLKIIAESSDIIVIALCYQVAGICAVHVPVINVI